jgi:hypothetical protein
MNSSTLTQSSGTIVTVPEQDFWTHKRFKTRPPGEGWLANEGIATSKETKWHWAIEAAAKVRELGAQSRDVWNFMREVGAKLKA